jgi:lipoprotein-anchoring transpeptidase ErfK/SrfK
VSITSGAAGSRTRTGTFSVFWKDKNHKSSLFNNAPMPNSVFFDGDIAFHQGSLYDQSNGCIHLSWDASSTFFNTLSVGDKVYVWGAPPY